MKIDNRLLLHDIKDTKEEFDDLRFEKEAYNTVIQRLIKENEQLRKDKERLFNIIKNSQ